MPIEYVRMSDEDIELWLPESMAYYEAARMRAGDSEAEAQDGKRASLARFFPDGRHLVEGQHLFAILADGEDVGWLWLGPWKEGGDQWWVWDIHIRAPHRRHGYARAAMEYAAAFAKEHGAPMLGLNVFAYNVPAIELYESLGFEAASLHMVKSL
ncbi:GNAT family N-acetyltransferase [Agromyces salentinus]|uniref:N-acetyltransferase domain-containing protein n=1 Tax=Agromyces salentinus TaxID=269421 RepID=A0ABN2MKS5_9MICO|nr:GNAT family N-acetyltransferase [Agromyces salentinus]